MLWRTVPEGYEVVCVWKVTCGGLLAVSFPGITLFTTVRQEIMGVCGLTRCDCLFLVECEVLLSMVFTSSEVLRCQTGRCVRKPFPNRAPLGES